MSKPKAQVRKAKYVPQEYRDPTRDYQKEAETLMWTDENGKPISRVDLINYDTSDRTIFEPTSNSQFDQPQVNHYDKSFINQEKRKQKAIQKRQATRDAVSSALDFVPIVGDIKGVYEGILQPLQQGNYLTAGIGAGMMLLPNIIEKPLKSVGKGIKKGLSVFDNIKLKIPIDENTYYRTLHNNERDNYINAINDAFETGIIRGNPNGSKSILDDKEHFIGPYFHKGNPRLSSLDKAVIVSKETSDLQWANINPHALEFTPGNFGQYTPLYKGVFNKAPAKYFEYYERGTNPISKHFWFKRSFDGAVTPPDIMPFDYGKNSNILIHMDFGDHTGWNGNGAYIEDGLLLPGKNSTGQRDFIWFNEDKPYAMGVNGKPFTRAIVTKKADWFTRVRDMKESVGQWDPSAKKSFVLSSEYVTPYPIEMDKSFIFDINPVTGKITLVQ